MCTIYLNSRECALFFEKSNGLIAVRNLRAAKHLSSLLTGTPDDDTFLIHEEVGDDSSRIELSKEEAARYTCGTLDFRQQVYDAAMTIAGHLGGYGIAMVDDTGKDMSNELEGFDYNN
jgi:hypothetical protein